MAAVIWIAAEDGKTCDKPVAAHNDSNTFVAAARHAEELLPGVFCPDEGHALIPWGGNAIEKNKYFVLSNPNDLELVWEEACDGSVPLGAVRGGKTNDGEGLYIGRIKMDSSFVCGKVHPSHATCYIPHEGSEKKFSEYEVLCVKSFPCLLQE